MTSDEVIVSLRAHEPELRTAGIVTLLLFRSTARNEAQPQSDSDLLDAFDDVRRLSPLDMIGTENLWQTCSGAPVDLIEDGTLKPRARGSVSNEIVRTLQWWYAPPYLDWWDIFGRLARRSCSFLRGPSSPSRHRPPNDRQAKTIAGSVAMMRWVDCEKGLYGSGSALLRNSC